jgi:hypothetical protein
VDQPTANSLVLAEFLPAGVPLFSLAQLQHANLSQLNSQPAYAVGNSLADYRVPLTQTRFTNNVTNGTTLSLSNNIQATQDLSYLLNEALYDHYFLSTAPDALTAADLANAAYRLPNARNQLLPGLDAARLGEVRGRAAFDTAAAHLLVNGGFNINSTSEQAWRALLAGTNAVGYDPETGLKSSTALSYPFSRYVHPSGGFNASPWAGYRQLTKEQINGLAANIVREIRLRGPFPSLANFVNRRLQAPDATDPDGGAGFKGAIQSAIDRSNYEGGAPINTDPLFSNPSYYTSSSTLPAPASIRSDLTQSALYGGTGSNRPYSSRAAFAPGYMTQADVLTAIGPSLTARSDTFVIRAYGDMRNAVTSQTEGRAWCEAVVQRLPEYVDTSLNAWETPATGSTNATFGRRFRIVSFRWLSPADI